MQPLEPACQMNFDVVLRMYKYALMFCIALLFDFSLDTSL